MKEKIIKKLKKILPQNAKELPVLNPLLLSFKRSNGLLRHTRDNGSKREPSYKEEEIAEIFISEMTKRSF